MRQPEEADWADLLAKRRRDGVIAVRTTRIHCRFGCPARAPLRKNVVLFDCPKQAVAEGFRACLRCGGGIGPSGLD